MNWIKNLSENTLKVAIQKVKQKQFLWLVSAILLLAFGYHFYNNTLQPYLLVASIISLGLSFIVPKIAFPLLYCWMLLGGILSEISSTIVLAIIYFLAFLPIKLFKFEKQKSNGWVEPNSNINFEEQF